MTQTHVVLPDRAIDVVADIVEARQTVQALLLASDHNEVQGLGFDLRNLGKLLALLQELEIQTRAQAHA